MKTNAKIKIGFEENFGFSYDLLGAWWVLVKAFCRFMPVVVALGHLVKILVGHWYWLRAL